MERRHDQDQTDKTQDTRWRRFEAALVETAAATSSTQAHIPLCSYFLTFSHYPPLSLQQTSHLLIFDHLSRFVSRFFAFFLLSLLLLIALFCYSLFRLPFLVVIIMECLFYTKQQDIDYSQSILVYSCFELSCFLFYNKKQSLSCY